MEGGAQGISSGAVKPSLHLSSGPEVWMVCFRDADRGAGFRISPKRASRPSLYGECSEATQLHSIASDQCRSDLAENGIDTLFNVLSKTDADFAARYAQSSSI
jgi:hypothetical protein